MLREPHGLHFKALRLRAEPREPRQLLRDGARAGLLLALHPHHGA